MKRLRLCAVRVSRFSRARAAAPDTMIVETSSAHASTGRLHLTRHSILHDVSTTDMTHVRTEPDTQRAQAHSHTQTTPINGRDTTPNKKPHRTSYPFVQKARYAATTVYGTTTRSDSIGFGIASIFNGQR